jgi:hypothetical protein
MRAGRCFPLSAFKAISGMIEMWLFSIIPRAMRLETNSGQEKVEHFALLNAQSFLKPL